MDCRTARLLVEFGRPLAMELEDRDAEDLQEHLADCPMCGSAAQAERLADHTIGQAVRAVPVPVGLRERLQQRLDVEMRGRIHRRWRRVGSIAAAAACVVFAVWVGFTWRGRKLLVDPNAISEAMPFPGIRGLTRMQAQEFFRAKGFAVTAPLFLDYRLLEFYGVAPVAGRDVPLLLFMKGANQARVYLLPDDRFDVSDIEAGGSGAASGYKVEVRRAPMDPHLVYLILYTGDSLQPFLADPAANGET